MELKKDGLTEVNLPENAHRELRDGEAYVPLVVAEVVREATKRTIAFGLLMVVLFSAAAAYIALKLGQGIEVAIPVAIFAIGYSAICRRKSTLLENVNIIAIGATSGIVAGGAVFVMPAIFIKGLETQSSFLQIALIPVLGAVLGVLFLIPFRRYFTTEMHGKLPFPEATATTEIILTGARGGRQAAVLLYSLGFGFIIDYLAIGLKAWNETFTTSIIPAFDNLTTKVKVVFNMNSTAAAASLGYIIGVKYAAIIMAGSLLAYFVLIPMYAHVAGAAAAGLTYRDIFFDEFSGVRNIGIGAIFAAGIISILKMSPVIWKALTQVIGQIGRAGQSKTVTSRLDRDVKLALVVSLLALLAIGMFFYFRYVVLADQTSPWILAALSTLLVYVVVFLFSAVSAWAVAMISVTPISGMTLTTIIISAVALAFFGLAAETGMLAVLLIGGVVCTALSMSGSLVTQFKIGQWLGSTPKSIQWSNILASFVATFTVTGVIFLFANLYGFGNPTEAHPNPLAAPQASAMAAVAEALFGGKGAPWMLYSFGAVISVIMTMLGISALAFALGMYLPIELNSPILIGACVAWLVQRLTKDEGLKKARENKGILVASGLIAGGALAGVFDGFQKMACEYLPWTVVAFDFEASTMNWTALVVFFVIVVFLFVNSWRVKYEPPKDAKPDSK